MTPHPAAADQTAVEVDSLDFCYGSKQSLFHVTMKVPRNRVTAFIGPSGCGKSTLLRCINRMNDRIPEARVTGGSIRIDGVDVTSPSLDPIATVRVEELMHRLKEEFTIIVVTHNMQQATRVSDLTGFFMLGRLVEFDSTEKIFSNPSMKETEDYITGRFS